MPFDAATLAKIDAQLTYLVPDGQTPFVYAYEPPPPGMPQRHGTYAPQTVAIHDARPVQSELSLDRQGFELHRQPSATTDLYDEAQIRQVYYPEVDALIRAATGASHVVIFDHTLRNTARGQAGARLREPAAHVHNDYTAKSAPKRVRELLPPGEAEARLQRRYVEVNVWRPIHGPVETWPLALCDARSVADGDLVAAERRYEDRIGETYVASHNPTHRWYYFPRMAADEALVIKCFDSATDGRARLAIHTAFADPTAGPDAAPRESIEVRAFAFFDA